MQPDTRTIHCTHRTREGGMFMVNVLVEAGIPKAHAYAMECHDVHTMALVIARAGYVAKADRTLVAEIPDRLPPAPRFRLSDIAWPVLLTGILLCLGFICAGVVGFLR